MDSAIARNIQHSLECYDNQGHFRHLAELYEQGELTCNKLRFNNLADNSYNTVYDKQSDTETEVACNE